MKERNTIDELIIDIAAVGVGILSIPYTLPVGAGCIAVGTIAMGMNLFKTLNNPTYNKEYKKEISKIINIIQVNNVCNKNNEYVTIDKVYSNISGFDVSFNIPIGMSYKDIDCIIPAISCALDGKTITRNKNVITIKFTDLEESYDLAFPPLHKSNKNKLKTFIGCNLNGYVQMDLSQAGGILIAGQTGSGKSTVLRYMLTYIAINYDERDINLYLNDLKYTELTLFKDLRITKWHNTDVGSVLTSLTEFWNEIQKRFRLFESIGSDCTDAYQYELITGKKLPINLMVIEEFTILSGKQYKEEVELLNNILCQCRASKSHVIITTQRPDAKTLDPRLKANITHTIGLKTKSAVNSQIICDSDVLKDLRGNGHGYLFDNKGDTEFQAFNIKPEEAKSILKPYKTTKSKKQEIDNVIESTFKYLDKEYEDEF